MANKFCGSCGKPLETDSKFCPGCGAKIEAEPVVQAAEPAPERPVVPVVNQPNIAPAAPKKDKNNGLPIMITMGVLGVAVIVLLCILLFGGNGGDKKGYGKVLSTYSYGDIVGDYTGDAVLNGIKMTGDAEEFAEALRDVFGSASFDAEQFEAAKNSVGRSFDADVDLTRSGMELEIDFLSVLDDFYIDIVDCYFDKGRAKDVYTESRSNGALQQETTVNYDLSLYQDERYDYRICGGCKVTQKLAIVIGGKVITDVSVVIDVELDLHMDY